MALVEYPIGIGREQEQVQQPVRVVPSQEGTAYTTPIDLGERDEDSDFSVQDETTVPFSEGRHVDHRWCDQACAGPSGHSPGTSTSSHQDTSYSHQTLPDQGQLLGPLNRPEGSPYSRQPSQEIAAMAGPRHHRGTC